ncbi:hypothetical protein F5I97DRAFT_1927844 [Phlebopus sp. FC_14]|nr:hypothetical protein F5I97DRAFT_1927844 [Phlebopus sp. FC_14]
MATNDDNEPRTSQDNLVSSRSIIPDPLGELPAWFKKESDMAAANISTFRIKYPLYNPNGPRWYKNHHLLPPPNLNRPPPVFPPSFPPMAASVQERSEDSTRLPGPSRTPSGTPLPTPTSSQVRIPELGGKPRSRKTSQDNVDLMDVSDPWGTHWHHQSPYDAGTNSSPVSADPPERTRSRLSSINTGQTRRKTVTPSPLSQSTSALHLQAPEPSHVTRKLSKRRKPVLGGLFSGQLKSTSDDRPTADDPSPSFPTRSSTVPSGLHVNVGAAKRHSTLSPTFIPINSSSAALSTHSSTKNERRGSVLGRLVRRFSILKKSAQDTPATTGEGPEDDMHQVGAALSVAAEGLSRHSFVSQRQPSPEKTAVEKKQSDPSKRVPPPRIDGELVAEAESGRRPSAELERGTTDHRSSISYDVPFSPLGKLTIANPDAPSSGGTTPVRHSVVLPPEMTLEPPPEPHPLVQDDAHPLEARQLPMNDAEKGDKPLSASPPPVGPSSGKATPAQALTSPISASAVLHSLPDIVQANSTGQIIHAVQPSPPETSTSPSQMSMSFHPSQQILRSLPRHLILPAVNDSPLSKASVLANPPTPYNTDEPHPELPIVEKQRNTSLTKQHDGEARLGKTCTATGKKTETFKLVRNPSDKLSSSGEAISAEGEQWLVINSADIPRRRKTKERTDRSEGPEKSSSRSSRERDKERVRESRREQRKQEEKAAAEVTDNQRRATSHTRVRSPPISKADSGSLSRPSRARSLDHRPTLVQPMVFTLQDEPPCLRKSDDRPRELHHQARSKPTRPGPSPIVTVARVERLPSTSARPTSELTSAADINALKAREAWEMDRLWKGRSMYQGQPETNVITSPSSMKESKHVMVEPSRDTMSLHSGDHGSSHTSYVVQPLQAHPIPASVFYANMPSAPPPIIYAATTPYGQAQHSSHRDYTTFRSLPNSFAFPSGEAPADPPARVNPLPRPPRESSYVPAHLPALADRSSGSASEYWTKYTSVPSH